MREEELRASDRTAASEVEEAVSQGLAAPLAAGR